MRLWPKLAHVVLILTVSNIPLINTSHATDNTLRQTLGGAVNVIEHPILVETARLNLVSVTKSRQYAFKTTDRISGYPITGKLVSLNKEKSQQLAKLLLDKNNYAYGVLRRSKNQSMYGIRYTQGPLKVEIALGIPCNQTIVTFKVRENIKRWGEVLGDKATKKVLALLGEKHTAD